MGLCCSCLRPSQYTSIDDEDNKPLVNDKTDNNIETANRFQWNDTGATMPTWATPREETKDVNPSTECGSSSSLLSPVDKTTKIISVKCPGKKIAIRSVPNVQISEVVGYVNNGDLIEVYKETIGGFFKLLDKKGFVNKFTKGVEWVEMQS